MTAFHAYIGVDYSGAGEPGERQAGIQVFRATAGAAGSVGRVAPPRAKATASWSRRELSAWLGEQLFGSAGPVIAGIDHAFSFPESYMRRHGLTTWDAFLKDFEQHWPTRERSVEVLRAGNARTGSNVEMRLADQWSSSAKSVFLFDVQGSVAKSTHAGIPWLAELRRELGEWVHFWPFDGFEVPAGRSVVAEVYPSLVRRRYVRTLRSADEHDAMAVCTWLRERDAAGFLGRYLEPPLTEAERALARLEGWILGVA